MPSRCPRSKDGFAQAALDYGNRRVAAGESRRMLSAEKLLFSKSGYPSSSSSPPFVMQASPVLTSITRVRNANEYPLFFFSLLHFMAGATAAVAAKMHEILTSSRGMHLMITIALALSPPSPGPFRPEESRTRRPPFSLSRGENKGKGRWIIQHVSHIIRQGITR